MAIPSANVDNYLVYVSMSSWLSGEERRLRSEGARVQVPEEAERFSDDLNGGDLKGNSENERMGTFSHYKIAKNSLFIILKTWVMI